MVEIFGNDTADYERHRVHMIDNTPLTMFGSGVHIGERKHNIRIGVADAISTIETTISVLKERLEESGETAAARAINAYQGLDLHPEIAKVVSPLYRDGHYAHAVEDAVKALNALVQQQSGLKLDGMPLCRRPSVRRTLSLNSIN
jgi:hypothetical protein